MVTASMDDSTRRSPTDPVLLDLYKLSVEMADRVSVRRASANTMFLTIQSAVIASLGFLEARTPTPPDRFLLALCAVGAIGSVVWYLLLRSYRDLNGAKYKVITAIEERLPASPFTDEWQHLKRDPVKAWRPRYAELGTIERLVPTLFFFLNVVLAVCLKVVD